MQVNQLVQKIRKDCLPYGLYLQKQIVPDGKQGFNLEPYLAVVSTLIIIEFCKGVVAKLGEEFVSWTTKDPKKKEIDIEALNQLIHEARDFVRQANRSNKDLDDATGEGVKHVRQYLISIGIPSYKAEAIVDLWITDLKNLLIG